MSLVNINGDDHVLIGFDPAFTQIKTFDSGDGRGQFQEYNRIAIPTGNSFSVANFIFIAYDGYAPLRYAGIDVLPVPIGAPPPRPDSGYLYPRRTQ